jgi:hypothetical protein
MAGRRASFWLAVAGVSLLASFGAEVVANRWPQLGLSRFVAFAHKGVS